MAATKGAKVIDISRAREKRQGAFKSGEVKDEGAQRGMTADMCIAILNTTAPVSENLRRLLAIPESMFYVGISSTSLSSEPGRSISALFRHFRHNAAFPEGLPDYGIHIDFSGSNAFAVLYDARRRIAVCEAIENAWAGSGSWEDFESSVSSAQFRAEKLARDGQPFKIVTVHNGTIRVI